MAAADTYRTNRGSLGLSIERNRTVFAISGRYERDTYEHSTQLDQSRVGGEFRLERRITPHLSGQVDASYYRTSYVNVDFVSNDRMVGGVLKWRFGRDIELAVSYDNTVRTAAGIGGGFRENRGFVTVAYRPPAWTRK